MNRHGIKCLTQTVYNTPRKLKLKWFKTKKSQKLTIQNKIKRIACAKYGKFTLQPFQNKRNDGIWAEDSEAISPSLIHAPTDKFQKGIIFWGAISSNGLIPAGAPINFTKWLHQKQFQEVAPVINKVFENTDVTPIFQDDQDNKHRTTLVKSTVADLFDERIESKIGDAKFCRHLANRKSLGCN
ncbi:unnamed protein product [Rotaria sp. Silwood1]|nr:unnamed protein product [Rotaria sp. Silwood1]